MVKLKAGKAGSTGKAGSAQGTLCMVLTHKGHSPAWWVSLRTEVAMMPAGPRAFWETVLKEPMLPVDPRVAPAILQDARGWAGWSARQEPLEVKTFQGAALDELLQDFRARGQPQVADALKRFAAQHA